jgi:hypothetical protein
MANLSKYELSALEQLRFMASQFSGDPLAFGQTLEVVKEQYRVDPWMKSDAIRWDTLLRQAEIDEQWPFRRIVKREGTHVTTTFQTR